ncbi:amidohydrolase family protein [Ilumatobacter coccineus]|uniref:Putative 2-amino-3-carboxymuconate-6-semialdehyde decarboxylase n=1 Tax=Ilumatobacter coccineus (strain NBRC 103263 / KCTC 29153 / YM16-304) TaxID=1313172 RepID=A0A6C7EFG1_ILUCY|nr:amidohydrolase family protein [Ilumatobacter coccineus]BAN03909.1 putative 2-amino-3-carboxymuconate-6-semialdehyde decarboxylase [Ilumatobacter coccineus YM16-304]
MSGVFDLHAHVVLGDAFGAAGKYGPFHGDDAEGREYFRVGEYEMKPIPYRRSLFMNVDLRLEAMDRVGIERQMLSPNPLTLFGKIEASPAVDFARATNDAMAAIVAPHPSRLVGAAQVALQDPDAACAELERAVDQLGLVAAYIGTDYGVALDDPSLDDFYRTVVARDVPLFIHGVTNDGVGPAPDQRLHRFGLDLILGYTYEETMAVASLVLGGVLERHPDLDVCVSHGGGAIAFLAQRFDSMASFRGRDSDFAADLRRLWFDSHLEPGRARDLVVDTVGVDRMVYGTNFGGWDTPEQTDEFDAGLTRNAERLLRLEATT